MISNTLIYLFSGILVRAIPFILLPILTHYLSPEEFGKLAIFQALIAFLIPFIGMNMHNSISKNFTKMNRDEMAKLMGNLINVIFISTILVSIIIALWIKYFGSIFDISNNWIIIIVVIAVFNMTNQFNLTLLRNQEKPWSFSALETGNTIINLSLSLLFIIGFNMAWEGRALGIVISISILGMIGLLMLYYKEFLIFNIDRTQIRKILHLSIPLIPHALGSTVIIMSDRLFLENMVGTHMVGIYVIGVSFGLIVNIFVEAFNRAWSPWLYKKLNDKTNPQLGKIVEYSYLSFVSYLMIAFIITGLSYFALPYIVSEEYQDASQFIIFIAIGYAFRGMYTIVFPYLVHESKTLFLSFITPLAAILNLVANYFLIDINGAAGAAQATLIAFIFSFLGTWWYANRIHPMPWKFKLTPHSAKTS